MELLIFHLTWSSCKKKIIIITETLKALQLRKFGNFCPRILTCLLVPGASRKRTFLKATLVCFCSHSTGKYAFQSVREAKNWNVDRCQSNKGRLGF